MLIAAKVRLPILMLGLLGVSCRGTFESKNQKTAISTVSSQTSPLTFSDEMQLSESKVINLRIVPMKVANHPYVEITFDHHLVKNFASYKVLDSNQKVVYSDQTFRTFFSIQGLPAGALTMEVRSCTPPITFPDDLANCGPVISEIFEQPSYERESEELTLALTTQQKLERRAYQLGLEMIVVIESIEKAMANCLDPELRRFFEQQKNKIDEFKKLSGLEQEEGFRFDLLSDLVSFGDTFDFTTPVTPEQLAEISKRLEEVASDLKGEKTEQFYESLLSIPLVLGGIGGLYFSLYESYSWQKYLQMAHSFDDDKGGLVRLRRHKSGFLVFREDIEKDLKNIPYRYMDDPETKILIYEKVIVDGRHLIKPYNFTSDIDQKFKDWGVIYSKRRGSWLDVQGKKIMFLRDEERQIDKKLNPDHEIYGDMFKQPLKRIEGLAGKHLYYKYRSKVDDLYRSKYDPSMGSKFNKFFRGRARHIQFAAGLLSVGIGIFVAYSNLTLAAIDSPVDGDSCAAVRTHFATIAQLSADMRKLKDYLIITKMNVISHL